MGQNQVGAITHLLLLDMAGEHLEEKVTTGVEGSGECG